MTEKNSFPKVIFGTSSLGNLFVELDSVTKNQLVKAAVESSPNTPVFDSAGKYGAGLALESLAAGLKAQGVSPSAVKISNKLGWKRVPLKTSEPTFEPGAWINLKHDAVQDISYQGILDCYQQGNELLGDYEAKIVSIHDPDEYLARAENKADLVKREQDILDAYKALIELRDAGKVDSVGVGAKDVSIIDFISDHIQLDWAMFACSVTPYTHEASTILLLKKLNKQGVKVINSAVFNAGFLIGSDNFDYKKISRETHAKEFAWRDKFNALCEEFEIKPAEACVQFSFLFDGIVSIALNSSSPKRIKSNILLAEAKVPDKFWQAMKSHGLISI
ncbi:aldo/keto reductase [Colwellia psychrerythraea]|uniref:NADP-dependent oxidoreductase domain containing protein n=1 Tax=Colwellia psychrerythraea TaxID=28229 RepID=A0A099KQ50_COLPS|nr:aldo/keto reductase [Colwellia psychrerythraea]KGJ92596.1 NADP-dependent oxidoreductase domain containing protein [Colwellia psychrerythraea]